jgi:signal transduction histidine kinase
MSDAKEQITTTILAVIIILLFFGVLFLVMLAYYNYRRRQTVREKQEMKALFDQQLMLSRLEIQEQTFTNISEEIHDNVGQLLSLVKIQLSTLDEGDAMDRELLQDARENVGKAFLDLRNIAKGLHAGHNRALNIREAVDQEAKRISRTGVVDVSVTSNGTEKKLNEENQLILFRIIQECLQNCLKHAEASFINIGFLWQPEQLRVRVRDDGKGFNVDAALGAHTGLGLQNILNRARVTGGTGEIRSAPGEGTTITVDIPYA